MLMFINCFWQLFFIKPSLKLLRVHEIIKIILEFIEKIRESNHFQQVGGGASIEKAVLKQTIRFSGIAFALEMDRSSFWDRLVNSQINLDNLWINLIKSEHSKFQASNRKNNCHFLNNLLMFGSINRMTK